MLKEVCKYFLNTNSTIEEQAIVLSPILVEVQSFAIAVFCRKYKFNV